jgi:6-phosphogluconolactonase
MEFHPTLDIFYVIEELTSRVEVFEWTQSGALNPIQDISSLPDGWTGVNYCADIHADPSGKFLYTSNRGHNSVTAFTIEEITGKIRTVTQTSTQGEWPRNFLLDPAGEFIFVANQNTDNVSIFRWDTSSGRTTYSGNQWKVPSPVYWNFKS